MSGRFLPGVPAGQVEAIFDAAPGREIANGKFDSPESSAALAANAFGYFLNRPRDLPPLPECGRLRWPPRSLELERTVRFPWRGGRHPVLDILIATSDALIGIESKRYEPFRPKAQSSLSDAYWRDVWGRRMNGYQRIRDDLRQNPSLYAHLDAAQLVKHALGLRTQVRRKGERQSKTPILVYLYAEPEYWSRDGEPLSEDAKARHRREIQNFSERVEGNEVEFVSCSYRELLTGWQESGAPKTRVHAETVMRRFAP